MTKLNAASAFTAKTRPTPKTSTNITQAVAVSEAMISSIQCLTKHHPRI